ncbi:MAG TPA: hypothetical protein VLU24_08720, partial [Mycobacterium sp.]|nr:hypothetical protein [Mycobacterium sp.]
GGHSDHDRGKKSGHHDQDECRDDGHGGKDHHRHHSGHKRGSYHRWDRHDSGHHDKFMFHFKGQDNRHDDDDDDCDGGGGEPTTGSIAGTVRNNGLGANGYPLFLLSTDGATVVATTTTAADGTGNYTFAEVNAGTYLLCEADPFTDQWGMLSQTRPNTGPACPGTTYAPIGFAITLAGGDAQTGNDFANFGLE